LTGQVRHRPSSERSLPQPEVAVRSIDTERA
jgi:hypothetical protein